MKIKSILNLFKRNKGEETKTITYPGKESVIYSSQVHRSSREKEELEKKRKLENELFVLLKKTDKTALVFDESLQMRAWWMSAGRLELKDIHLDEKTGETVMIGAVIEVDSPSRKKNIKNELEIPLVDCLENVNDRLESQLISLKRKEYFNIFEKDILAVLKNDDKIVLLFDERLHVFSSQYNRKLILKDIHLDKKTGEIVMVGGDYKEPVMEKGAFKTGFERPLRDCPEDMIKSNEKECLSRLLCKGREAVVDKYILEPMRKLCLHGLQIDGSLDFSTYGFDGVCFKDKKIDGVYVYFLDKELKAVTVKDKNGEELKLDELTLEQIQSVGFQLFKLLEAFQEART